VPTANQPLVVLSFRSRKDRLLVYMSGRRMLARHLDAPDFHDLVGEADQRSPRFAYLHVLVVD
jgi:hypothetical protein